MPRAQGAGRLPRPSSRCPWLPPSTGERSLVRVERAEVVLDVVTHRQRDVAAVQRGQRVVVEVREDLLVAHVRTRVDAGALLVALRGLPVTAGARNVRRVAWSPEPIEWREDVRQVAAK